MDLFPRCYDLLRETVTSKYEDSSIVLYSSDSQPFVIRGPVKQQRVFPGPVHYLSLIVQCK
jgi:hypothetical protein